jgi:hypothetical protein
MRTILSCLAMFSMVCASVGANEPQSLSATIDGNRFAGDDDTILLVPLPSGPFTLNAATAGAASYPSPKTPIDRLSIMCRGYAPGKLMKLGSKDFDNAACNVTLTKAAKEPGKDAQEYSLDKRSPATVFEITAAHGKVIEGRFGFHLVDKAGHTLVISDGTFVAEDRQL